MRKFYPFLFAVIFLYHLTHAEDAVESYQNLLASDQYANPAQEKYFTGINAVKSDLVHPAYRSKILGKTMNNRPSLSEVYVTGHFKIHYTTTGSDAVDPTITNSNNVPDFVWETGIAAERSYRLLIDMLKFDPPPEDNHDGPEIDIYIRELQGGNYALTYQEDEVTGTSRQHDYTGYTEIDNNFQEPTYATHGLDAMRVTVAHEFFHIVQMGYNWWENNGLIGVDDEMGDAYFLEWCSTWFEERAYPEVNDYYQYLNVFFYDPTLPIWSNSYWYSLGPFVRFLVERFSDDDKFLSKVWGAIKEDYAFQALQQIVKDKGGDLSQLWNEFLSLCYYTAERYDPAYALSTDAANFPPLNFPWQNVQVLSEEANFTLDVQPFATQLFCITFDKNQYIGIQPVTSSVSGLIGSYLIDRFKFMNIWQIFSTSEEKFIGEVRSKDTVLIFLTNSSITTTANMGLTVVEITDIEAVPNKLLSIYPNPYLPYDGSPLVFKVQIGKISDDLDIRLFDLVGREIFRKKVDDAVLWKGVNEVQIVPEELRSGYFAAGIYIARVQIGRKTMTKKIVIIK